MGVEGAMQGQQVILSMMLLVLAKELEAGPRGKWKLIEVEEGPGYEGPGYEEMVQDYSAKEAGGGEGNKTAPTSDKKGQFMTVPDKQLCDQNADIQIEEECLQAAESLGHPFTPMHEADKPENPYCFLITDKNAIGSGSVMWFDVSENNADPRLEYIETSRLCRVQ